MKISRREVNGVVVVTTEVQTPAGSVATSEGLVEAMEVPYRDLSPEQIRARIRDKYSKLLDDNRDLVANFVS